MENVPMIVREVPGCTVTELLTYSYRITEIRAKEKKKNKKEKKQGGGGGPPSSSPSEQVLPE
jgi:hypothetical protein